jgi:hypothetical protein
MAKKRDEDLLRQNLGLLPFKTCPKCNVLIEKYAGCNAVKCTQCNIAFCWRCNVTDPVDGKFDFTGRFFSFSKSNFILAHPHFYDKSTPCFGKTFDS